MLAQKQPESLSKYPFILFLTHTPALFPFAMCVAGSHCIFSSERRRPCAFSPLHGKIMKVTICIGSSCHLKGSRQVVEQLQRLITEHGLADKVSLAGSFCLEQCQKGVCVTVDGQFFSVSPETVNDFFVEQIQNPLSAQ